MYVAAAERRRNTTSFQTMAEFLAKALIKTGIRTQSSCLHSCFVLSRPKLEIEFDGAIKAHQHTGIYALPRVWPVETRAERRLDDDSSLPVAVDDEGPRKLLP